MCSASLIVRLSRNHAKSPLWTRGNFGLDMRYTLLRHVVVIITLTGLIGVYGGTAIGARKVPMSGGRMLALSHQASVKEGSVHFIETSGQVTLIRGKATNAFTARAVGDFSFRSPGRQQDTDYETNCKHRLPCQQPTKLDYFRRIFVGSRAAEWDLHQGWNCDTASPLLSGNPFDAAEYQGYGHAAREGSGHLRGMPVWKVRMTVGPRALARFGFAQPGRLVVHYSIAQSGYELLQARGNEVYTTPGTRGKIRSYFPFRINLSRYGEPVSIHLPRACRAKQTRQGYIGSS